MISPTEYLNPFSEALMLKQQELEIPTHTLLDFLKTAEALPPESKKFVGKGNQSLVIKLDNQVLKVRSRGGMSDEEAKIVAAIAYPTSSYLQERVVEKLTDTFEDDDLYLRQAVAHQLATQLTPTIADKAAILTTNSLVNPNRVVALVMPAYSGTFYSLSDRSFGLEATVVAKLKELKVEIDDFSRRKNGVILEDGQRRIFDITVASSVLKNLSYKVVNGELKSTSSIG
jgi:hypothetical protein